MTVVSRGQPALFKYLCESTPGIAAARNRALRAALADELLVFIDDDETPHGAWLSSLLNTHAEFRCAGVVGPVISNFDKPPDEWIRQGGFFERRRMPTGTNVNVAATNNLLLDVARIRRHGVWFDPSFGLSGGSDTLFSRKLSTLGEKIVWCDEAIVFDHVPASRISHRWVLLRSMRYGNSWSRSTLVMLESVAQRSVARSGLGNPRCDAHFGWWNASGLWLGRVVRSPRRPWYAHSYERCRYVARCIRRCLCRVQPEQRLVHGYVLWGEGGRSETKLSKQSRVFMRVPMRLIRDRWPAWLETSSRSSVCRGSSCNLV